MSLMDIAIQESVPFENVFITPRNIIQVVKFSKDGEYLMEFGSGSQAYDTSPGLGQFSIPHGLILKFSMPSNF